MLTYQNLGAVLIVLRSVCLHVKRRWTEFVSLECSQFLEGKCFSTLSASDSTVVLLKEQENACGIPSSSYSDLVAKGSSAPQIILLTTAALLSASLRDHLVTAHPLPKAVLQTEEST